MNIHLASGFKKTVVLNKVEIIHLYAAYLNRMEEPVYTLYYDGSKGDKINAVVDLTTVNFIDMDSRELDDMDMAYFDYSKLRIWTPPGFWRKLKCNLKWRIEKIFKKEVK